MIDRGDSFYETVAATSQTVRDQVPANGKTWEVLRFIGSGAYLAETSVKLVWDYGGSSEEVLASTHGDANIALVRQVVGDGAKKLALVLENTSLSGQGLGARYEAREL